MNKVIKTFPLEEGHYIIHARKKSDGECGIIVPKIFVLKKRFIFFKWNKYFQDEILNKDKALKIAKELQDTGLYQDVFIVRDNGCDVDEGFYYPTVVYKNGIWTNYDVAGTNAINVCGSNKNATLLIVKKSIFSKISNYIKCLFKNKKKRLRRKK
jgi:hypothetical protein